MNNEDIREQIRHNYSVVLENVRAHAQKVNRNTEEIRIVAVTKTHPVDVVRVAVSVGLSVFGENYAQELREKAEQLKDENVEWHFIGRIQTNKLKYIVPVAKLIHSVYRVEEVKEIDRIARKFSKVQDILIEVNVSGEETKAGLRPEEVLAFLNETISYENVRVIGLMTMAPYIEPEDTRPYFRKLRELRDSLNMQFPDIIELSMGMTNDYGIAVEEGATILRIGTAIFGERIYKGE
ncbi:MAG: YggS family pyridoxal phosphate-dependent enzyme [Fervidobacterium sp.]|uniref:YggS family pyridoxal phosphate-dependent enzyme n=1 Tax=Fervidobacterium sp. TaxID=1871331 RepID=UPI00404AE66C